MKLATYRTFDTLPRLGVLDGDSIVDAAKLGQAVSQPFASSMLELIDQGPDALHALRLAVAQTRELRPVGMPIANVTLCAPIPRPRKNIFGVGLNYQMHINESPTAQSFRGTAPDKPILFSKAPTAVIGPGEPIKHNRQLTQQLDWEVELAVIIGKRTTAVSAEQAMQSVFGYSIIVDITARDCRRSGQWLFSKSQDSFAPMGPTIVTADAISDPHTLELWLNKNGVEKQRGHTKDMLFKIPELIADISSGITLEPGDIIATGTPDGVGAGRDPQEWLVPGDVICCGIDPIGVLSNPVIDAQPRVRS